jgi:hypothetical protein
MATLFPHNGGALPASHSSVHMGAAVRISPFAIAGNVGDLEVLQSLQPVQHGPPAAALSSWPRTTGPAWAESPLPLTGASAPSAAAQPPAAPVHAVASEPCTQRLSAVVAAAAPAKPLALEAATAVEGLADVGQAPAARRRGRKPVEGLVHTKAYMAVRNYRERQKNMVRACGRAMGATWRGAAAHALVGSPLQRTTMPRARMPYAFALLLVCVLTCKEPGIQTRGPREHVHPPM